MVRVAAQFIVFGELGQMQAPRKMLLGRSRGVLLQTEEEPKSLLPFNGARSTRLHHEVRRTLEGKGAMEFNGPLSVG